MAFARLRVVLRRRLQNFIFLTLFVSTLYPLQVQADKTNIESGVQSFCRIHLFILGQTVKRKPSLVEAATQVDEAVRASQVKAEQLLRMYERAGFTKDTEFIQDLKSLAQTEDQILLERSKMIFQLGIATKTLAPLEPYAEALGKDVSSLHPEELENRIQKLSNAEFDALWIVTQKSWPKLIDFMGTDVNVDYVKENADYYAHLGSHDYGLLTTLSKFVFESAHLKRETSSQRLAANRPETGLQFLGSHILDRSRERRHVLATLIYQLYQSQKFPPREWVQETILAPVKRRSLEIDRARASVERGDRVFYKPRLELPGVDSNSGLGKQLLNGYWSHPIERQFYN